MKIAHLGGCRCKECDPLIKMLAEDIARSVAVDPKILGTASSAPSYHATKEKLGIRINWLWFWNRRTP